MKYIYGMKLRGSGPGCQPDGLVEVLDFNHFKSAQKYWDLIHYWNLIAYDRQLSEKEIEDYDLEFVCSLENYESENK